MHLWSKTQPVTAKGRKIDLFTIWLSRIFLIFFDFDPQNSKCLFFLKNKCLLKPKFWNYQKKNNGRYVVKLHTNNTHTKFQNNIFVFGCAMVEKPGKGDDVTVLKCTFWHFLLPYVKTNNIFGILRQNWSRHVFRRKFRIGKFDLFDMVWHYIDLYSGKT